MVKMNYFYASQAKDLDWVVFPTGHSMRVSFVIESIKNGVPKEHIVNCCRWQSDYMFYLYKNNHLEHTRFGSCYTAVIANENPNTVPRRAWEGDGPVTDRESLSPPPSPIKRLRLRLCNSSSERVSDTKTTPRQAAILMKEMKASGVKEEGNQNDLAGSSVEISSTLEFKGETRPGQAAISTSVPISAEIKKEFDLPKNTPVHNASEPTIGEIKKDSGEAKPTPKGSYSAKRYFKSE